MLFPNPVKRTRLLALLLLAAFAWGTTAELGHHHGTKPKLDESFSSTAPSPTAAEATSTQISSSNTNGTSNSKTGAECLICQLHQNLSATVIGHTPAVGSTETHATKATTQVVLQLSEFRSTGHGRAPPSIL
jgi:hypothetical protein